MIYVNSHTDQGNKNIVRPAPLFINYFYNLTRELYILLHLVKCLALEVGTIKMMCHQKSWYKHIVLSLSSILRSGSISLINDLLASTVILAFGTRRSSLIINNADHEGVLNCVYSSTFGSVLDCSFSTLFFTTMASFSAYFDKKFWSLILVKSSLL